MKTTLKTLISLVLLMGVIPFILHPSIPACNLGIAAIMFSAINWMLPVWKESV